MGSADGGHCTAGLEEVDVVVTSAYDRDAPVGEHRPVVMDRKRNRARPSAASPRTGPRPCDVHRRQSVCYGYRTAASEWCSESRGCGPLRANRSCPTRCRGGHRDRFHARGQRPIVPRKDGADGLAVGAERVYRPIVRIDHQGGVMARRKERPDLRDLAYPLSFATDGQQHARSEVDDLDRSVARIGDEHRPSASSRTPTIDEKGCWNSSEGVRTRAGRCAPACARAPIKRPTFATIWVRIGSLWRGCETG